MVREPLGLDERERGRRLGRLLRQHRGERSMVEVATAAGISVETLRKIETGRIPTPALFTVAAVAEVLGASLDTLVNEASATALAGLDGGQSRLSGEGDTVGFGARWSRFRSSIAGHTRLPFLGLAPHVASGRTVDRG